MNRFLFKTLCVLLLMAPLASHALEAMQDAELSGVTGQEGISLGLELRVNADANGNPLSGAASDARPGIGSDINCGTGVGVGGPCTFALEFANRTGKWLVFKNYSYALRVDQQYLDASVLSDASDNTAYYNAAEALPNSAYSRFQTTSGACLISGGDCSFAAATAALNNSPALQLGMPDTTTTYTRSGGAGGTGVSTGYTSILLGGTVGGLSAEFDNWDGFGSPGWQNVDNSSFLGLNIRDNNSSYAGIRITGNVYVFGF